MLSGSFPGAVYFYIIRFDIEVKDSYIFDMPHQQAASPLDGTKRVWERVAGKTLQ
jgi:hypothetical protein